MITVNKMDFWKMLLIKIIQITPLVWNKIFCGNLFPANVS